MNRILINERCKYLFVLFAFGFFGGCIYFNILWRIQGSLFRNEWGMILDRVMEYSIKTLYGLLFESWHCFIGIHVLVCISGLVRYGKILIQGIVLCIGVLAGAMETLLLLSFDIKTSILFQLKMSVIVFPYVILIGSSLILACAMSLLKWTSGEKTRKWRMIQLKKYTVLSFLTLFIHLVYIVLLSYVNFSEINLKNFFL